MSERCALNGLSLQSGRRGQSVHMCTRKNLPAARSAPGSPTARRTNRRLAGRQLARTAACGAVQPPPPRHSAPCSLEPPSTLESLAGSTPALKKKIPISLGRVSTLEAFLKAGADCFVWLGAHATGVVGREARTDFRIPGCSTSSPLQVSQVQGGCGRASTAHGEGVQWRQGRFRPGLLTCLPCNSRGDLPQRERVKSYILRVRVGTRNPAGFVAIQSANRRTSG